MRNSKSWKLALLASIVALPLSSCRDAADEDIKRFGALSLEVDSLGQEVSSDIYQSCLRKFGIGQDITAISRRGLSGATVPMTPGPPPTQQPLFPDEPQSDLPGVFGKPRSSIPNDSLSPAESFGGFPTRRSSTIEVDVSPSPVSQEIEPEFGSRISKPNSDPSFIEDVLKSRTQQASSSSTRFEPLRRLQTCNGARSQSDFSAASFSLLSEYGELLYFLVSGDRLKPSDFLNTATLAANQFQVRSPQSEETSSLLGAIGINVPVLQGAAQNLIGVISKVWLADVKSGELRRLVVCRNDDIQNLAGDLANISSIFYGDFVLKDETRLKNDYFEVSYISLESQALTDSLFDESVQRLTLEFEQSLSDADERKERAARLAGILESFAFYHNQAADKLSESLSEQDRKALCAAKEDSVAFSQIDYGSPTTGSIKIGQLEGQKSLAGKSTPEETDSHSFDLTIKEKRELASLLSSFVESIK